MAEPINFEISVLLQLLAKHIFEIDENIKLNNVDLEKLYEEARNQTVLAIAFDALPKDARILNPKIYDEWQTIAFSIMQQTINNNYSNANITELFDKNGIEQCTIKGYSSAYYYPNPCLRQMGDIDFIIDKDKDEISTHLLLDNGFICKEKNSYHSEFVKGKMIYEMHIDIAETIDGKSCYSDMIEDIIRKSNVVNSSVGAIRIPSKFHHGVTMLVHMQRHMMTGSGIGLRHLVDWAVFVNSIDNDEWIEIFEEKLKKVGLWKFAETISKTASIYIKLPEKEWFSNADKELAAALICDILDGGNFGRKSTTRNMQKIVSANGDKSKMVRLLQGLNSWIYTKYPICSKYKILLPMFYVLHSFKIFFKVVFKRSEYKFSEVFKKGEEQYNMYEKFGFYREEK